MSSLGSSGGRDRRAGGKKYERDRKHRKEQERQIELTRSWLGDL